MSETENTPAMTDEQLSEIEARLYADALRQRVPNKSFDEMMQDDSIMASGGRTYMPLLLAEVRRLRSLFTADDARLVKGLWLWLSEPKWEETVERSDIDHLASLGDRIRSVSSGETRE